MKRIELFVLLIAAAGACKQSPATAGTAPATNQKDTAYIVKTGGVKMITIDGKYKVWTKKVGEGKIKVLLLHGGPGFTHDYFECFEDFLPVAGIEFYYYDQLGAGNSDIPADTALWNIPRYVEEVEQVRKGLGLDQFYLLGHSWGSMLAMEYLLKYQNHVKAAVLSNMTAGIKSYETYAAKLKEQLLTRQEIKTYDSLDRLKLYDSPQYQDLLMNGLYTKVVCRIPLESWPEPFMRAFKKANHAIYIQMQGVDEFHVTGNFRGWEMWDSLHLIKVPTLVLGGMHDEMNPDDMIKEGKLIPNSHTYLCPNGSHLSMYDDQQNYFTALLGFLKAVESNQFSPDRN